MSVINLVENGTPRSPTNELLGVLFECAEDAPVLASYARRVFLRRLLGDAEPLRERAHTIARKLLSEEPRLRGVRQLSILEENVIAELQAALALLELDKTLRDERINHARFDQHSQLAPGFARLQSLQDQPIKVTAKNTKGLPFSRSLRRSIERIASAGLSVNAVAREISTALDRLDPYHRRSILKRNEPTWAKGEIWFYSTAYTFTLAGLLYERFFDAPFRFLVENEQRGGRALAEIGRPFVDLYRFVSSAMAPNRREIASARATIERHLRSVELDEIGMKARELLLAGPFMHQFWTRHLPLGLFLASLFKSWFDAVKPRALVTGNYVFEGYPMQIARQCGLPVITLQHGLFIDYCQFIVPEADAFIVRGRFWKDFLHPEAARHAVVLNPPEPRIAPRSYGGGPGEALCFLTAPYVLPLWNECEIDDILSVVLGAARDNGVEFIMRVHPLDDLAAYQRRIQRLDPSGRAPVTYSQGKGLDEVLSRSRLAVTYFSTVFQDCLRLGVPVVSLGWHDFAPKAKMAALGVFNFARDLADLRRLIDRGIAGELAFAEHTIEEFLASNEPEEIRSTIAGLLQGKRERELLS